ncbi:MAG: heme exporter protein CcmD [Gammaproteobacteria bacterium]
MGSEIIEFFNMGGYAIYVWLAYGITVFVLIGNVVAAVAGKKRGAFEKK